MAVVLDGWSVIARRTRVELALANGLASWFELAPNRMACADDHVCLVAFMVQRDALTFALQLDDLGLAGERDGNYRDVAIVSIDGPWQHACAWLAIGRHAGVAAAWSTSAGVDAARDPLVVPVRWKPHRVRQLSEAEAKRLELVRRDGDVEVYRDTKTGELYYRGRSTRPDDMPADVEAQFRAAVEHLAPLLGIGKPPRKLGLFEKRRLARGIRTLEAFATGDRWRAWWYLGHARRRAGDAAGALDAFEQAYRANPTDADVARELGGQALAVGNGARAVAVCERNCSLHPTDAGLRANLALACVIANDLPRAALEITRALEIDRDDRITRALADMIDEITAGKRARPTKVAI